MHYDTPQFLVDFLNDCRGFDEQKAWPKQFAFWQKCIAGDKSQKLTIDAPEAGFYRLKRKTKEGTTFVPLVYWFDADGALSCYLGESFVPEQRARMTWNYQIEPIEFDLYVTIINGGHWPDLNTVVTKQAAQVGDNSAPDPNSFEGLRDALDALYAEAKTLVNKGAALSQSAADAAADLSDRLSKISKNAEAKRKVEKQPFLDGGREVDAKWNNITERAEKAYKAIKSSVIAPFLTAQKEAKRKEAEEQAKLGISQPDPATVHPSERESVKAGTRGRSVSLRQVKYAIIEDYAKALAHFANHEDVKDAVQNLCTRAVRNGVSIPGVTMIEKEEAV